MEQKTPAAANGDPTGSRSAGTRKLAELVADDIRTRIGWGGMQPGSQLPPERDLLDEFGVSRPTLREALRILEAESLISIQRGAKGGAVVRTIDPEIVTRQAALLLQLDDASLGEVYQARRVIEPPCAALLANRADMADIAELREIVAQGRRNERDPIAFAQTASLFHRRIVELARNAPLSLLAAILKGLTDRMYEVSVANRPRRFADSGARLALRSWERLIGLIAEGDAVGAEAHWNEHMAVVGTNPGLLGDSSREPLRTVPGEEEEPQLGGLPA